MIRHLAPVALSALLVAACGDDAMTEPPTTEPPTTEPPTTTVPPPTDWELPTDPDAVVLQIDVGVNQPDGLAIASGYPYLTVYADGRVISRDRSVESGVLPPLVAARISADGVRQLVQLAIDHGALTPLDYYGSPNIADADGTGFVVATADTRREFGVYALGERSDPDDPYNEVTPQQQAARDELGHLRTALLDWESAVADHVVEPPSLFTGESIIVVAHDEFAPFDAGFPVDPNSGGAYETRVEPVWCTEVSVADNPELVDAAISAEFTSFVVLRQVLPHEHGCAIVPEQ